MIGLSGLLLAVAASVTPDPSAWAQGAAADSGEDPRLPSGAAPDSVLLLPVVEVRSARPPSDSLLRITPGFALSYDVSQARGRAMMVSDLIDGAAGVHVRQFGGVGSFATASIRGASAAQVAVYLDGVPLNQAQYGVVNLADLPVEALDRVEVFRGAAPLEYESPGGGAINLVTAQAPGRWVRLSAGAGSFATRRSDVSAGLRGRHQSLMVVTQLFESDGNFVFLDDNVTSWNQTDDTLKTRVNNHVRAIGLTGRADTDLGPVNLAITHDRLSKRNGLPGIGANQATTSSLETEREVTSLLIARRNAIPAADAARTERLPGASLRLYAVRHRDQFSDTLGQLTGVRQASDDRTRRLGAAAILPWPVLLAQHLTWTGEIRHEEYEPRIVRPRSRTLATSRRRLYAWGVEDRWALPALRLELVGSLRHEVIRDSFPAGPAYPGALPSPAVYRTTTLDRPSAGVHVDLGRGFALKGSWARLPRVPTLEELFGNRGGVYGNPRALPERVESMDVGLLCHQAHVRPRGSLLPSAVEIQAAAYRTNSDDLLVYIQNSQRSMVSQNISAARMSGFEADARLRWEGGLTIETSWTHQRTRDEGEVTYWYGMELPGRPRDEAAVQATYARKRWRAFYGFHYVSGNFLNRSNTERVPARALHDLGVGWRIPKTAVETTAECRNLDDQRIQDYAGYPLPGRALYFGLSTILNERRDTP